MSASPQTLPECMTSLPHPGSLWFCDDRTMLQLGPEGPQEIHYFGPDEDSSLILSNQHNDFLECFRPSVRVGNVNYAAEEGTLAVAPFGGLRSQEFAQDGLEVRIGLCIVRNCVLYTFDVRDSRNRQARGEMNVWPQCFDASGRTWTDWRPDGGAHVRAGSDRKGVGVAMAVAGGDGLAMRHYREEVDFHGSGSFRFSAPIHPADGAFLVLALGSDARETAARAAEVARTAPAVLAEQLSRYDAVARRSPKLASGSPMLDRFFGLAPAYLESLKVRDFPGAIRAKTAGYWVWLWDAALPGLACPPAGQGPLAADMARFFLKFADPRKGVPFAYARNPAYEAPLAAESGADAQSVSYNVQGLVEILAYRAAVQNADDSLIAELYTKLKHHFGLQASGVAGDTGLIVGPTAFPDAAYLLDQTETDLCPYNNGVWYNACRAMERLALKAGDEPTAERARELALAVENHFWKIFWDPQRKYLANSADKDFRRRQVYTNSVAFWDFGFGNELCDGYQRPLADYQLGHFYSKMGISILSPDDERFWDRDGNQFHCSWPVMDSHNLKLALWARNEAALAHFTPWVEHLIARHTVPEAIQMRVKKSFPVVYDPGAWQAYTTSSWYQTIAESLVGVWLDEGGATCTGTPAAPMRLTGLHYRGGRINVTTLGRGWEIASLECDGQTVGGSGKIGLPLLQGGEHEIRITRSDAPPSGPTVLCANGTSVRVTQASPSRLTCTLEGGGLSRVLIRSPRVPAVSLDGQDIDPRPAEHAGTWWIDTLLRYGQEAVLSVMIK